MSTKNIFRGNKSGLAGLAIAAASLFLVGCGTQQNPADISRIATGQNVGAPVGTPPPNATVNVSQVSVDPLLGTYFGQVIKMKNGAATRQPFELTLEKQNKTVNGYTGTYLVAGFSSTGELGTFRFSSYLIPDLMGVPLNGGLHYWLNSSVITEPNFSAAPFAFQLILATSTSGAQFDPTQSAMYVKDCGFSQVCSNFASDVTFDAVLGKRK